MDDKKLFLMYATLNNEEFRKYLAIDYDAHKNNGLTKSLYEHLRVPEIVARLMDNRNFQNVSDETKKKMIYSDYYPESSKVMVQVYLDDRRNLCQELHNKVCTELKIPPALVEFVNFTELGIDDYNYHYYNPREGKLYLNQEIDYSECLNTELSERVLMGTFEHELHYQLRKNYAKLETVDPKQQYVLLSILLKEFVKANLNRETGINKSELEFDDASSPGYVYSLSSTYDYLNKVFEKYGFYDKIDLEEFRENRAIYHTALVGDYVDEETEDDFDSECIYNAESGELIAEDEIEDDVALLEHSIEFDLDMIYAVEMSEINKRMDNFFRDFFLEKMSKTANSFYSHFGYLVEYDFEDEYSEYVKNCKDLENLSGIDEAIPSEDGTEFE